VTHFRDLTRYEYLGVEDNTRNVGWLSAAYEYPKGRVSRDIVDKLERLSRSAHNLTRGHHVCELCTSEPPREHGDEPISNAHHLPETGNGEIRITAADGVAYAAPVLLVHYIEAHDYLPPAEFLDAVASIDLTSPGE